MKAEVYNCDLEIKTNRSIAPMYGRMCQVGHDRITVNMSVECNEEFSKALQNWLLAQGAFGPKTDNPRRCTYRYGDGKQCPVFAADGTGERCRCPSHDF